MQFTKFINFKKITLLLLVIILCSGCSSELYYKFDQDKIDSTITIKYNSAEFRDYIINSEASSQMNTNMSDSEIKMTSEEMFDSYKINSFKDNDFKQYSGKLTQDNDKFTYVYNYEYKYNEFKNNNIFNNCFLSPVIKEDRNAYYFALYGDFTCRYSEGMKLVIDAPGKLLSSNSDNEKNGKATWTIDQTKNDIYFAISKKDVSNSSFNKFYIIGGVVLSIVTIITLFLYKKAKEA